MAVHASFSTAGCIGTLNLLTSVKTFSILLALFAILAGLLISPQTNAAPASKSVQLYSSSFPVDAAIGRRHNIRVARAIADATKLTEDERNQFINELVMAELARRNAFLRGLLTMEPLQNVPLSKVYSNGGFGGAASQAGDFQRIARDEERGGVGAGGGNKWDVLSRAMPR